jgi:hypothetical protein
LKAFDRTWSPAEVHVSQGGGEADMGYIRADDNAARRVPRRAAH